MSLNPQVQDKFEGAFLGAALGDALGSSFISWHFVSTESFIATTADRPLHPTVATDYLLQAATTLLELDDWSFTSMLEHLKGTRETENTTTLFQAARRGTRMSHSSASFSRRIGIPRDIAAVLSIPAVALAGTSTDNGSKVIDGLSHLLEGLERRGPSLVFAAALHEILSGRLATPINVRSIRNSVERHVPTDLSSGTMSLVARLAEETSCIDVMNRLKASQPSDAVPTAIWAVLQSAESFSGCTYAALSIGQDANANAMLAGALSGALLGAENIPSNWVNQLSPKVSSQLRELALRCHRTALTAAAE